MTEPSPPLSLMWFISQKSCPTPAWIDDHIELCHLQRYVEFAPSAISLAIAIVYTVYSCTIPTFNALKHSLSGEKLLKPQESLVELPADRSDESSCITIRTKSIGDKIRIISEIVLCLAESAILLFLWRNDTVQNEYTLYCPNAILFTFFLSFMCSGLNFYRLAGANNIERLPGSPFTQCAFLYVIQFIVYVVSCSTYMKAPLKAVPYLSSYLFALSAICFAKLAILYTSPLGDGAARIYYTPSSHPSLEPVSSLIRQITCCWNVGLILSAKKKNQLQPDDIWLLPEDLNSYKLFSAYAACNPNSSFIWRLIVCFKSTIAANILLGCAASILSLTPTYFVNRILKFMEDTSLISKFEAWLYVLGIFMSFTVSSILSHQAYFLGRRLVVSFKAIIMGEVYQKVLLSQVSRSDDGTDGSQTDHSSNQDCNMFNTANTGAIINLMSVDASKIADFCAPLQNFFASPLIVLVGVCYLYALLGISAFAGIFVMLLAIPLNYKIAKTLGELQGKVMTITDKRIDKTNESLNAIRIIKYFAWENKFLESILDLRNEELKMLWKHYVWHNCGGMIYYVLPLLITGASFICYVAIERKPLTSAIAFTSMAIFNILRFPLDSIATNISTFMSTKVSVDRVQSFFDTDDTPKYNQLDNLDLRGPNSPRLGFEDASFTWSINSSLGSTFKLQDLNVRFIECDLNVIIGPTGSGKTSMLMALLGEMFLLKGQVFLPHTTNRRVAPYGPDGYTDTVAFCPQQAWMVNDTVRNNILFASKYDPVRYEQIIRVCELENDLAILDKGDGTLIGDKGITLSGGQKQRIALARALYSSSRHLILDDCLSAVDSHSADAIYNNALVGHPARGRTIILVSHNVALAVSQAAQVVIMRNGRVSASGTPIELAEAGTLGEDELTLSRARASKARRLGSGTEATNLTDYSPETDNSLPSAVQSDLNIVDAVSHSHEDNTTEVEEVEEEKRGLGSIPLSTYANYGRALGSRAWWYLEVLLMLTIPIARYAESWWLKNWTSSYQDIASQGYGRLNDVLTAHTKDRDASRNIIYFSGVYILMGVTHASICASSELYACFGSIRASSRIYRAMLSSILRAKVSLFDSTPIGRIVNRFSKDIMDIDQELMIDLHFFLRCVLSAIAITIVITWTTPSFLPIAILTSCAYMLLGRYYLPASRELKRLESTARSPIYQQLGETLEGVVSIRAYGDLNRFGTLNMNLIDASHRPHLNLWLANRWMGYWSNSLSTAVVTLASLFVVWKADSLSAGAAGVSLSYAMTFGDAMVWIVRMYTQVELHMNSVERVEEYIGIDGESDAVIPENRPPASWPQKGAIKFLNLCLRYKPQLSLVISDVSFEVEGGQKIGIVGRTGAGKSSILSAIFRILEPESGSISIDGIDISTIGLQDLRKALAIIPQEPTLFTGTLRSNLDLFDEYTDNEVYQALGRVHLVKPGTTTANAEEALACPNFDENVNRFYNLGLDVSEGGKNLSQGQRQLVCLARAVLRRPRVLVMDEATASIDSETDSLIQAAIREEFADVTVLTIAHRLRTIADYDRVLVLDQGQLAQYGSPAELLHDRSGIYYDMCSKSGELATLVSITQNS